MIDEKSKAEWVSDEYGYPECSRCGFRLQDWTDYWSEASETWEFCPNCGSEM